MAMVPARLLWPWEVLEMDLQDMKQVSSTGTRHRLVVVDRASRFLFAYPLEPKDSVGVARKLLEMLLTFEVPLPITTDAEGEFTGKVVTHLCQWVRVELDHGPTDHPCSQGAVKTMGWLAPGGLGGALKLLAGNVGRVHNGGLLDSKDYAGSVSHLRRDTLQDFVWSRCAHKSGCSYACAGRRYFPHWA